MTRYEKSDAQLDAEASAPTGELSALIELHRAMWRDDNEVSRLNSRQPPLTRYDKDDWAVGDEPERLGATEEYVIEPGARVGMSMSGNMIRRLSESPGSHYPWVTALGRLRADCRRLHPHHRSAERPYWRGALCWQVVYLVIVGHKEGPLSPENAARVLRLEEIEPLLRRTLRDIETGIDYFRRRAERRATEDAGMGPGPVPTPQATHHAVPGMHETDCPQCRKVHKAA